MERGAEENFKQRLPDSTHLQQPQPPASHTGM